MTSIIAFVACITPVAIDGDTIRCKNIPQKIRLAGIDAPDKTCVGRAATNCMLTLQKVDWIDSKAALERIMRRGKLRLWFYKGETYGRKIAVLCGRKGNVNAEMVRIKFAIHKPSWNGSGVRFNCNEGKTR